MFKFSKEWNWIYILIWSDSQLVVNQLNWNCIYESLKFLRHFTIDKSLLNKFDEVTLE